MSQEAQGADTAFSTPAAKVPFFISTSLSHVTLSSDSPTSHFCLFPAAHLHWDVPASSSRALAQPHLLLPLMNSSKKGIILENCPIVSDSQIGTGKTNPLIPSKTSPGFTLSTAQSAGKQSLCRQQVTANWGAFNTVQEKGFFQQKKDKLELFFLKWGIKANSRAAGFS